jgi:hypothetical protein
MYADNMIMGENTGERILNSISVCQSIKNWFQRPTYTSRLNDYASTMYTSLKWHRNKKCSGRDEFVVVLIMHLARARATRKNKSSTR